MNGKEVILTPDGYKRLEEELEQLRTVRRKEVAERIKNAISFGDISENSEYNEAKQEQAFLEGRVMALEKMLRNARVLDADEINTEKVGIGSIVLLKDLEYNEEGGVHHSFQPPRPTPMKIKFPSNLRWAERLLTNPSAVLLRSTFLPVSLNMEILAIRR